MFGRLFGSSNRSGGGGGGGGRGGGGRPNSGEQLNQSIQTLRGAIAQLEKRETHLEKKIAQQLQKAKAKSKARDKKGALYELKKKKQLEKQLESIMGKKLNLETQIMALEDAHLNAQTMAAFQTSRNAMQSAVREADLDRADELVDDITEAMDQVQEMNEAMAQPIGPQLDEDELEEELAMLDEELADELMDDMPTTKVTVARAQPSALDELDAMPAAPTAQPKRQPVEEEDDELAQLEAMMG